MYEIIITGIVSGIVSGFIIIPFQYFLSRWLDKRIEKMLKKKSFKLAMEQMRDSYRKREKEFQEAGMSMSDCFQSIWEDLNK